MEKKNEEKKIVLTKDRLISLGIGVLIGVIITSGAFCLCRCRAPRIDGNHSIEMREDNFPSSKDMMKKKAKNRQKSMKKIKENNQTIEQDDNSTNN